MIEITGGLTLDGRKYHIVNRTYDEPFITISFYDPLPEDLKLAMGGAVMEHLLGYDLDLNEKEW
jgi:hypothetical protein